MISSILQSTGSNLQEVLYSSQKRQEEMLGQSEIAPATFALELDRTTISAKAAQASQNMMSRNFASAEREVSRYTKATLQGLKVNQQMDYSEQSTLTSIMQIARVDYANAETLGEKYKALNAAEKRIFWYQEDEVRKSAEETYLKASREALQEKAETAMLPKDKNGESIASKVVDSANKEVPMPEISGSNQAPAPDVAVALSTTAQAISVAVATAPAPSPDVSTPTAPSTPSIDITI